MSRIGRKPISIPAGVNLEIGRSEVVVKGPKGELRTPLPEGITVRAENSVAVVERSGDSRSQRMFHGLTRSLLANAIKGVSEGFQLGYSHPIEFSIPKGISIQVEGGTKLTVSGIDKQLVGQVAANIRSLRKPDVYKGKGIRYKGEGW